MSSKIVQVLLGIILGVVIVLLMDKTLPLNVGAPLALIAMALALWVYYREQKRNKHQK